MLLDRAPFANELVSRLSHAIVNDKELESRVMHVLGKVTSTWIAFLARGQELGAIRADLPVRTLLGVFQAIKESLIREYTTNDRIISHEEFERIYVLLLDLFRRVSAPPVKGSAPPVKPAPMKKEKKSQ